MIHFYVTSFYKATNDPYLVNAEDSIGGPIYMLAVGLTMKPALKLTEKAGHMILIPLAVSLGGIFILLSSLMPSFFRKNEDKHSIFVIS